MKKNYLLCFCYSVIFLTSCGDNKDNISITTPAEKDDISATAPEKRSEVSSKYELGACNEHNASESILVTNEKTKYFCNGVEWAPYTNICKQGYSSYINPNTNYDTFYMVYYSPVQNYNDTIYYHTVEIGTQTWMAENMRTSNSTVCGNYYNISVFGLSNSTYDYGGYCNADMKAAKSKDIKEKVLKYDPYLSSGCPSGFHIPSVDEWATLFNTTGQDPRMLQAKGIPFWPEATDQYGLSIIPSGIKNISVSGPDAYIYTDSTSAYFWTSTIEINPNYTYYNGFLSIYYVIINNNGMHFNTLTLQDACYESYTSFSTRCIKN